jgi:hypothetical protein
VPVLSNVHTSTTLHYGHFQAPLISQWMFPRLNTASVNPEKEETGKSNKEISAI